MSLYELICLTVVVAAIFAYLNYRLIKLPATIGVMILSLLSSIALLAAGTVYHELPDRAAALLSQIDFGDAVLHRLLAFLLFAGALKVNFGDLRGQKGVIITLSTVGVVLSTAIVGGLAWALFRLLGQPISAVYCFLFGALISPTDPVAVLAIVRKAGAPVTLETKIAGESLFNDGIGVVIFLSILEFSTPGADHSAGHVASLLLMEAVGGAVLGLVLGWMTYVLLKRVNNYQVEVLLTLALAMGGYALAEELHTSAPIAIVVAGLLIGNHGRSFAMSDITRQHLDVFWDLVDELLNVILFVLIGLEMLVLPKEPRYLLAGGVSIVVVLLARYASVAGTISVMRRFRTFSPGAIPILTWSGLRGAISVALALSLSADRPQDREAVVAITYIVVVFSIIVQGLTITPLVRRYRDPATAPLPPDDPAVYA